MPASHPSSHPFEADPLTDGSTCLFCGMELVFGGLHPEPPDNAEDGYELPRVCRACWHLDHAAGSCSAFVPSGLRSVPCHCGRAA